MPLYPEIPSEYQTPKYLADAYRDGWAHGHGIACHNVPTLGKVVRTDILGRVRVDASNIREVHMDFCYRADLDSRSYSPFEFTAEALNESENPEKAWEAFEAGIHDAIDADLASYTNEDYGITPADDKGPEE